VLLAVGYGFWRRFVEKPRRLEPNREAILILSLIAAIMVTDFAFDGFRFAKLAALDAGIRARGGVLAGWAHGGGLGIRAAIAAIDAGYHAFYWLQMLTVLTFLVLLPAGEHFHIVTALPTLFFARGEPGRRVPAVTSNG